MSKTLGIIAMTAVALSAAAPALAQDDDPGGFRVFWREGLRMETDDGQFQLRLGGRFMYDWVLWGDDDEVADAVGGAIDDGTEFRRARIFVQGYMYEKIEYKAQFDFAGGDVAFKDVYFGIRHPRYGFRMGHMKEPFGFETLTSSKYITFVERALPGVTDAERNAGFLLHGDVLEDRFTYGLGVFRDTGDDGVGDEPGRYNFTGRFAGAIIDEDSSTRVVHVGAAFTHQNADGRLRQLRQRPEVHLSPRFISSGLLPIESLSVLALESTVISGPFSAQAEWKYAPVATDTAGDPSFWGWYAFGSWFVTGESRAYSSGGMERVRPFRNFLDNGGLGAWELALRYSALDLNAENAERADLGILGSRLDNVTLGVNWYWNPMTVLKLNAVRADIDDVGAIWAFLWRGQIEF